MSQAVATELRGHWNNNSAHGVYKTYMGLSCFSPVINIARHPLWGRIQVSMMLYPLWGRIQVSMMLYPLWGRIQVSMTLGQNTGQDDAGAEYRSA